MMIKQKHAHYASNLEENQNFLTKSVLEGFLKTAKPNYKRQTPTTQIEKVD